MNGRKDKNAAFSGAGDAPVRPSLPGGALAVDYRPAAALIPYATNARTHSDAQVAEIAASIGLRLDEPDPGRW
jgi:hypothetical protein